MADIRKTIEVIIGAVNKVSPGAKEASDDLEKMASQATATGGALATFAAGAAAALGVIVTKTVEAGARMNELSERTGIAVEDLSRFEFVADQSNASLEDLTLGIKFLSKAMVGLSEDGQDTSKLFGQLGVNVRNVDGSLRPVKEVFLDTADALSKMDSGTERLAYTTALLGRGAIHLAGVMKLGREEIERLGEVADRTGQTISTGLANASDELDDNMKQLKGSLAGVTRALGSELIPIILPVVQSLQVVVVQVLEWTKANPQLASTLLGVVGVIGGAGGLLLLLGALTGAFIAITPAATAAWAAITGPVGLVTTAILALGGLVVALKGAQAASREAIQKSLDFQNYGAGGYKGWGPPPDSGSAGGGAPAPAGGTAPAGAPGAKDYSLTNAQALAFQFAGTRGNRSGNRAGGPASGPGFTPEDNSPVDPGLTFQLSTIEEFALKAGEALGNLPTLAGLAVQGLQGLGTVFGSITGGLGALAEAAKRWAIQMIQSILSVIAQGLILRLVLSFIPGLGPILNAGGGGGGGGGGGILSLLGGGGGGPTVPRGALATRGASGPDIHLHVGAFMGTRGEAVELGRMLQRQIVEAGTGVRG